MHSFGLPVPDPEKLEIFQHKREKLYFCFEKLAVLSRMKEASATALMCRFSKNILPLLASKKFCYISSVDDD
jgi:hypothetical protein